MDTVYFQMFMVVFSTVVSGLVSWLFYKIKKVHQAREKQELEIQEKRLKTEADLRDEINLLKQGVVSLLHNQLVGIITECEHKQGKRLYQIENVTKMYNAYHGLGGNGTVALLYEQFKKLPTIKVD